MVHQAVCRSPGRCVCSSNLSGRKMPTRRRLLVAFVACVAFGFVGVYMVWRPTAITWENFDRIRVGMTLEQVEAILGGPERDDGDGQWEFDVLFDQHVAVMGADG